MVIDDQSVWMDKIGFTSALSIDVSVKSLTSRGIAAVIPLDFSRRNTLTAKELYGGKEDECIEDGLYCFSIGPDGPGACGVVMSINRAFLPSAYCALDSLIAKAVGANDERNYQKVEWLIKAIEAQTSLEMIEKAKATYKVLKDFLKGLSCDCCK